MKRINPLRKPIFELTLSCLQRLFCMTNWCMNTFHLYLLFHLQDYLYQNVIAMVSTSRSSVIPVWDSVGASTGMEGSSRSQESGEMRTAVSCKLHFLMQEILGNFKMIVFGNRPVHTVKLVRTYHDFLKIWYWFDISAFYFMLFILISEASNTYIRSQAIMIS